MHVIELVYQPIVRLGDGALTGLEALAPGLPRGDGIPLLGLANGHRDCAVSREHGAGHGKLNKGGTKRRMPSRCAKQSDDHNALIKY